MFCHAGGIRYEMRIRRIRTTALVMAAVVVLSGTTATPAVAKAVSVLEACGANACQETTHEQTLRLLGNIGDPGSAPPPAQRTRWFRMVMTVTWDTGPGEQGHDTWVMRYYPAAGMMRDHRVWVQLPNATIAGFDELTRGLDARGAVPSAPAVVTRPDSMASSGGDFGLAAVGGALATAGLVGGALILRRRGGRPAA
jgi:hypothetical protein